ncbi:MAG: PAS domain S-box-containing protein [Psychroserpens sp.]|jgi:PAS domain S-box-containing protein|uniref:PAS domain-containing protein n=1 Tax=Psychroserpens sp. TaxID=2020870 RepID=UPI0039E642FD
MKYNLKNMMALDLYLTTLNQNDYDAIADQVEGKINYIMPLMSWDLHSHNFIKQLQFAQREQDILKVVHLGEKYHWQNDIQSIFKQNEFEALLLTDHEQRIVWVSNGFTEMTGYFKKEVLHKTPRILQGAETSLTSKKRIREKLSTDESFSEIITNYKKDGSPYKCEVKIFPLKTDETTHYLALERQVS